LARDAFRVYRETWAFQILSQKQIQLRNDYCIEHYVNDPRMTPPELPITQILIPPA